MHIYTRDPVRRLAVTGTRLAFVCGDTRMILVDLYRILSLLKMNS